MKTSIPFLPFKAALALILTLGMLAATLDGASPEPTTTPNAAKGDPALGQLVTQLQAKVDKLEAALAKAMPNAPAATGLGPAAMAGMPAPATSPTPAATMPGMSGMNPPSGTAMSMMDMMSKMDKMMGMMDKMKGTGGATPPAGPATAPAAGMGMEKMEMMGMMGMAPMAADPVASMPKSALPGFPGASHLYHIGATGFFLDHQQHITLTTAQQATLNKAKEQALLAKSSADRAIQQAEQELWTLTAADQPDGAKIKAKLAEIGRLTTEARLAFITAVGEASKLLTDEQRKTLAGFMPPVPAAPSNTMPAAPMKDM